MERAELERKRIERIKELGYLCFNLSVGHEREPGRFADVLDSMRICAARLASSRGNERSACLELLDSYAEQLGCECFNMYIDKKPFSDDIMSMCSSISDINQQIISAANRPVQPEPYSVRTEEQNGFGDMYGGYGGYGGYEPMQETARLQEEKRRSSSRREKRGTRDEEPQGMPILGGPEPGSALPDFGKVRSEERDDIGFKVNMPQGMEPIPTNAKVCICGYRNKSHAKFCGKCGAKL